MGTYISMINSQDTNNNKVVQELQNLIGEKIIASFDMVAKDRSNYFTQNPDQITSINSASSIINRYAILNGGISAAANLVPGPLGMIAVGPEIITVMRNQIAMIYDLGVVYGKQRYLTKELLAGVLICTLGTGLISTVNTVASKVIITQGSKILVRKVSTPIFKELARWLALRSAQQALKSSVSKYLPLIGSSAMGLWSTYTTKEVGKKAIQLFQKQIELLDETQSISEYAITSNLISASLLEANVNREERIEVLKIKSLINLMKVDGNIEHKEKEYLKTIIINANLNPGEINEIKNTLSAQKIEIDYSVIGSYPDDALGLLIDLITLARSDGDFHITEKMYIKQVGKMIGFSEADIEEMILSYRNGYVK